MWLFAIAAVLGVVGYRAYEHGTLQADLQKVIGGMRKISLGNNPAKQTNTAKLPPWAVSPGNPAFTLKNPDIGNFIGSQSSGGGTIVASGAGSVPVIAPSYSGGSGAGGVNTGSTATSTPTGGSGSKITVSRIS